MKILQNGKLVTVTRAQLQSKNKSFIDKEVVIKPEVVEVPQEEGSEDRSKYEDFTVASLKELLDSNNIIYTKTAKKADLVELADEHIILEEGEELAESEL